MIYTPAQARKMVRTISCVVRLLMDVTRGGATNLTPARIRQIKGIARGLGRVRLRRLASRLRDFARAASAQLDSKKTVDPELAFLFSDCVQTAKFVKTYLKTASARPEILEEVFDCRWNEEDLERLADRMLVEMAVVSEPYEKSHRLDSRYFVDAGSGDVFVSRAAHQYPQSEEILPPRPRSGLIHLLVGHVFPGFSPREIRLTDCAETEERVDEKTLVRLLDLSQATVAALAAKFAAERANYFAPQSGYELVRVHNLAAIGDAIYAMDPTGELLLIDRTGSPQGVRCVRLAERARLVALFGRVFRDQQGRLAISPLATLAMLKKLELVRL